MDSVLAPSDFSLLLRNAERHFYCLTGNGDSDNTLLRLQRIGCCFVFAQQCNLMPFEDEYRKVQHLWNFLY